MARGSPSLAFAPLVAAALGCSATIPSDDPGDDPAPAAPAVLPRLTASQLRNTLIDVFGAEVPATPTPPDTNPYLFYSIGATTTELSELGAQRYTDGADLVASWVVAEPARIAALLGCAPTSVDDPCLATGLADVGLRLLRRPLTADEQDGWLAVVRDTARGDVGRGLRLALFGMLQAPQFLYRVELGEPDPERPDRARYTSFEMASRLSFLLWDAAPDRELLAAAAAGELTTDAGLYDQAARLLESPRARGATQAFFAQYLDLGALDDLERDPVLFPAFSPTLAGAMKTELRLQVDDTVFGRDADVRELLSTRRTFVNAELAALYEIDAPGATAVAFAPVELPADGPRAGILTSAAFLSMNAHLTETSPTLRGKYVRERLLCQTIIQPPGNADLAIPEPGPEPRTLRERLEQHASDPACSGCHAAIDPPGYLFESFDALGAYRTEDGGIPVDSSGGLDGVPLTGARELGELLAADPRVGACLVKQLYRHASGRLDSAADEATLVALGDGFAAGGHRFRDLLVDLALSEGFRTVAPREVMP